MQIENIGQEEGAGLQNICYTPLLPAGSEPQLRDCVVQSVFGYYKNSLPSFSLNYTYDGRYINYLNTMNACLM